MTKISIFLLTIAGLGFLIASFLATPKVKGEELETTEVEVVVDCIAELPQVEFLGEGPGEYSLPEGYDNFLVKNRGTGNLEIENGPTYTVVDQNPQRRDRVWICKGNCGGFAGVHNTFVPLGNKGPGDVVELLAIDDDDDDRYHWWSVNQPREPFQMVEDNRMVEYLSYTIPGFGKWFFFTQDSLYVALACGEDASTPTATPTPTLPAPTATPVPTITKVAPPDEPVHYTYIPYIACGWTGPSGVPLYCITNIGKP